MTSWTRSCRKKIILDSAGLWREKTTPWLWSRNSMLCHFEKNLGWLSRCISWTSFTGRGSVGGTAGTFMTRALGRLSVHLCKSNGIMYKRDLGVLVNTSWNAFLAGTTISTLDVPWRVLWLLFEFKAYVCCMLSSRNDCSTLLHAFSDCFIRVRFLSTAPCAFLP